MRRIFLFSLIFLFSGLYSSAFAVKQELLTTENDTLHRVPIIFKPGEASEYINSLLKSENLWKDEKDTIKLSLSRLIDQFYEPIDSVKTRLSGIPYNETEFKLTEIAKHDTVPIKWLEESVFIIDTAALEKEPFITRQTIIMRALEIDSLAFPFADSIPDFKAMIDSLFRKTLRASDTITEVFVDYKYLEAKKVTVFRMVNGRVVPPLVPTGSRKSARFINDSSKLVISETSQVIMANEESPFNIVHSVAMPDSLKVAVETLLAHTFERDSIMVFITDIQGRRTPFWLSSRTHDPYRFWVKNSENDSITIWLGNPSKYNITMILEEDVSVERMQKRSADDIPIVTDKPLRALAKLSPLQEIPVYWTYGISNAFSLNQSYLANWSQGGQSSLAGMLDVRGTARYANKASKVTWTNNGRLTYGTIRTREQGFRTSTDILELNSQYNKVITNKLDFSSVFYGRTQVAKGYNYPNDSVVIAKFLNPGTFTVGVGVEYKPFKETLVNFSVLSYKNTFVLDTTNIRQTTHGIVAGKRAKQEMGGQLVLRNRMAITQGLIMVNAVRLFSNYIDKPKNVDVDWEMSIEQQINWLFTIRLNFHLIYDDDIRFPVFDANNEPVLLPDGTQRKVAKTQFKQFLGLTLSLRI